MFYPTGRKSHLKFPAMEKKFQIIQNTQIEKNFVITVTC